MNQRIEELEARVQQLSMLLDSIIEGPAHKAEFAKRTDFEELEERVEELEERMGNKATKKRVNRLSRRVDEIAQTMPQVAPLNLDEDGR